jgi:hypothetical protein
MSVRIAKPSSRDLKLSSSRENVKEKMETHGDSRGGFVRVKARY